MKRTTFPMIGTLALCVFQSLELFAAGPGPAEVRLDTLDLSPIRQGWGAPQTNRSVKGLPLSIGGQAFARGIGTHAPATAAYRLDGRAVRFTASVGVNDTGRNEPGSVEFIVTGDGRELFRSGVVKGGDAAKRIDVPLTGVTLLKLVVTDGGDNNFSDHADWADATIAFAGDLPEPVDPSASFNPESLYPPAAKRKASPGGTTYYLDPQRGDDANSGTDRAKPWRTFVPVNRLVLAAGDTVEVLAAGAFAETPWLTGAGTVERPIRIRFAPGEYDFAPDRASKEKFHISNSNDDPYTPKAVAILLRELKHARIVGDRTDLFVRGKMLEIVVQRCEDIVLTGVAFDYRRPLVSEFTIVDVAADHADVRVQKDCAYVIENDRLIWVGDGWRSRGMGLNQEYDPADDGRTWRRGNGPLNAVSRVEEISPFRLRLHYAKNPGLVAGRTIQFRETFRDCAAGLIERSKDVAWSNCAVHAFGGMAIVHQFSENLTYDKVWLAPRPGSGRTTAAWADMLHFSGCRGQIRIDGCEFSGSHDDPVNVHGTHLRIVGKPAADAIRVRFMHPQTYGIDTCFPGDEIEFVHHDTLLAYATNRVVAVERIDDKESVIRFAGPAPETREKDVIENVTWTPAVTIRGCRVSGDSCRGFLLTTRRPVLVESNTFIKTTMPAILIADDAGSWFESGPVHDVTIRGNRFIQCADPAILIEPENHVANPAPVHRNIRIVGNEFVLSGKARAVVARSVQGLELSGNRGGGGALPVRIEHCRDVRGEGR